MISALAPTVFVIAFALLTRRILLSLVLGLVLGELLFAWDVRDGLLGVIDRVLGVFADPGNTAVVVFCVLVGGLLALVRENGGVAGFVRLVSRSPALETRRGTELFVIAIGCLIFIESSITSLVAGTVGRPLFDRHGISREKLAYIADSTSAPICLLLPMNAWGAFILGLLADTGEALPLLLRSLPLSFYAFAAIAMVFVSALLGWDFGPMRRATPRPPAESIGDVGEGRARGLLVPVVAMVALVPIGLYVTGGGDFFRGSGARSVLYAVLGGSAIAAFFLVVDAKRPARDVLPVFLRGARELLSLGALVTLAIAFGALSKDLDTGPTIASIVSAALDPRLTAAALFVTASLIAFATGTSWGTFALTIPLALPLAEQTGLPPALMIGAALSGGVFGDHASPISDTTLVSAIAAGCEPIDHVRTQFPYALVAAAIAAAAYVIVGAAAL